MVDCKSAENLTGLPCFSFTMFRIPRDPNKSRAVDHRKGKYCWRWRVEHVNVIRRDSQSKGGNFRLLHRESIFLFILVSNLVFCGVFHSCNTNETKSQLLGGKKIQQGPDCKSASRKAPIRVHVRGDPRKRCILINKIGPLALTQLGL